MSRTIIKKNQGFTLIEILVTIGIFAIVMMVASAIFINVSNLQQQTANLAQLQNEGRYIIEKVAKEIRGRELDYGQMDIDTDGSTDKLLFKSDEYGEVYEIAYDGGSKSIKITVTNEGFKTAQLNSESVAVDQFRLILTPAAAPGDEPSVQSRVTLLLMISNQDGLEKYRKSLSLQTTISSKIYH
ncbi:MAG: prepilin-type N-terminal cleavage/methylation domain-containing protein [Patescibacteria group bacterium]